MYEQKFDPLKLILAIGRHAIISKKMEQIMATQALYEITLIGM